MKKVIFVIFLIFSSRVNYAVPTVKIPFECLVKKITASSFLIENKYSTFSYHPVNAFDNQNHTAWFEGVKGNGVGEYLEIRFFDYVDLPNISILNGYAKSKRLYEANGRIRSLQVSINDSKSFKTIELKDTIKRQAIPLNLENVKKIRFVIKSVYQGLKYSDVGLTEVKFNAVFSSKKKSKLSDKDLTEVFNTLNNSISVEDLINKATNSFNVITRKQFAGILDKNFSMLDGAGNLERNYAISKFVANYPRLVPVLFHSIYLKKKGFYFTRSESIQMEVVSLIHNDQPAAIPLVYHIHKNDPSQIYGSLTQLLILGDTRVVPSYLKLLKNWEGEWEGDPIYQSPPHKTLKKYGDQYSKNYIRKFLKKETLPKKLSNELKKSF